MSDDVIVDSSSTPESTATTDPAPTTPTPTTQEPQVPFHNHPRFRELTSSNRDLKGQVEQLRNTIAEMQRAQAQARSGAGITDQQRREFGEAAAALKQIIAQDPELAQMLGVAKQFPQLAQGYQSVQQMQAQAARAQQTQARSHIRELATAANLKVDDASLRHIVRLVAGEAMALENGNERYSGGDMSVLDEAFKAVLPFLEGLRKEAAATVAQTKDKTKSLPPAPRGGAAGQPAPPKIEAGKEREFESGMHKRATDMLKGLLGG